MIHKVSIMDIFETSYTDRYVHNTFLLFIFKFIGHPYGSKIKGVKNNMGKDMEISLA